MRSSAVVRSRHSQHASSGRAALLATMLYVLTGFTGYVMAEQGDPDANTALLLTIFSLVCVPVAAVLVARIAPARPDASCHDAGPRRQKDRGASPPVVAARWRRRKP